MGGDQPHVDMMLLIITWIGITEEGSREQADTARSICRSNQAKSDSQESKGTEVGSHQHLSFKRLSDTCKRIQDVGVWVVYRGPADGVHLKQVKPGQISSCARF